MSETVTAKVTICNQLGLHIRPSRQLASIANSYDAVVVVRNGAREANAESQLDLLMLAASKGTELEIRATGPEAKDAVDAIARLVNDKFGEEK